MQPPEDTESLVPSARMIRAARALLDKDQAVLAADIGVDRKTIVRIETDSREKIHGSRRKVLFAIKNYFEEEGIEFIFSSDQTGEGVRFRSA